MLGGVFFVDITVRNSYTKNMKQQSKKITKKTSNLINAQKERFEREARALRANLLLRQKQKTERERKCMHSK